MDSSNKVTVLTLKEANKEFGLSLFGRSNGVIRLADLSISKITVGERPLPRDANTLEELKVSIGRLGQTTPVLVRELDDGTHRLVDGWHRIGALSAIGQAKCTALILGGLTDEDAEMVELVSNLHRRKLSALDAAVRYGRLLRYIQDKVSQGATPPGGDQPQEKYHQKTARLLGISADRVARAAKITRIVPAAQEKVRALKLENNQSALLKIAGSGNSADLQIAKALELSQRVKTRRRKSFGNIASGESAAFGLGAPEIVSKDSSYTRIKNEWALLRDILSAAQPEDRQRFVDECLMPMLSQRVTDVTVAEGLQHDG